MRTASAAEEMYATDYGAYNAEIGQALAPTMFGGPGNPYYNATPMTVGGTNGFAYHYKYVAPTLNGNYLFCTQGGPEYGSDLSGVPNPNAMTLVPTTNYDICYSVAQGIYVAP